MGNRSGCCGPDRRPEPVTVNIYDLHGTGSALFKNMNVLLRAAGTGAFHAGVEVFGQEWSFGYRESSRSGVYCTAPRESELHSYRESIFMGETRLGRHEVERLIQMMSTRWKGDTYDMLSRNCCHFCDELCMKLDVDPLPDWLNSLAAVGAALGGAQEREAFETNRALGRRRALSGEPAPDARSATEKTPRARRAELVSSGPLAEEREAFEANRALGRRRALSGEPAPDARSATEKTPRARRAELVSSGPLAEDSRTPKNRPSADEAHITPRSAAVQGRVTSRSLPKSARSSKDAQVAQKDPWLQRDLLDPDVFKDHWRLQVQASMAQAEQVSDILERAKATGELERLASAGYQHTAGGYDAAASRRRSDAAALLEEGGSGAWTWRAA